MNTYEHSLSALADPTRRAIFEALRQGPTAVGQLAAGLPVSRPAVSQHLKVLQEAGLVIAERRGNRRLYSLSLEGLQPLRAYVESFWDLALDRFQSLTETNRGGVR